MSRRARQPALRPAPGGRARRAPCPSLSSTPTRTARARARAAPRGWPAKQREAPSPEPLQARNELSCGVQLAPAGLRRRLRSQPFLPAEAIAALVDRKRHRHCTDGQLRALPAPREVSLCFRAARPGCVAPVAASATRNESLVAQWLRWRLAATSHALRARAAGQGSMPRCEEAVLVGLRWLSSPRQAP